MFSVNVVTAVGPYHLHLIPQVRATVAAQTVACHHILVIDSEGRGPGAARNVGLKRVTSPLVVFLDADDWLEPDFVERTLSAFDGRRYVYTDWLANGMPVPAPDCPWRNRTWHCITTLLPTAWVRKVGGFDETIQGEDTDFYLKLNSSGTCGQRLAEPLFHYGKDGRRASAFVHGPDYEATLQAFSERYGGKRPMACGDCGDMPNVNAPPAGQQPGDVLVEALWAGNRRQHGPKTGRLYPRAGNRARLWVAPEDVQVAPHLWQRVQEAVTVPVQPRDVRPTFEAVTVDEQPVTDLDGLARAMFPDLQVAPASPVDPVKVKPNVTRARALAKVARA